SARSSSRTCGSRRTRWTPRASATWWSGSDRPRGVFDLPGKQERLTALEARASEPGFWDDSRTAQEVLREADGLRAEIELWTALLARTDDLETALELGQEAGDAELEAEVDRSVDDLER